MADTEALIAMIKQMQQAQPIRRNTPELKGRHSPSTSDVSTLQAVTFKDLQQDHRHAGKAIYLAICSLSISNGMTVVAQDSSGRKGVLWSLIEHPFPGGEASMSTEPYYAKSITGGIAVCVHHPTDILRLSNFDAAVVEHLPRFAAEDPEDFLKAGDAARTAKKYMEAADVYSEGIKRARGTSCDNPGTLMNLLLLLISRASTYHVGLDLHSQAFTDITEVLTAAPTIKPALLLAAYISLEVSVYHAAQGYALGLMALAPNEESTRKLCDRVSRRVQQAAGKYDLGLLAKSTIDSTFMKDVSSFVGDIDIRKSGLGGRGWFAKNKIFRGQLLLCEKALVISLDPASSSYREGLKGVMTGEDDDWCSQSSISFLHKMASAAVTDPILSQQLFDLTDGDERHVDKPMAPGSRNFDSYKALHIMKHNYHAISHSKASERQDVHDPHRVNISAESLDARGLWYMTELFNHSCLSSAHYQWIGDLMVVKASRDIEPNEEITVNYVSTENSYEERKVALSFSFGFECCCPLCEADAALQEPLRAQRETLPAAYIAVTGWEDKVRRCLRSYDTVAYKGLPYVGAANLLFYLAHVYLGPVSNWSKAKKEARTKAQECFLATIQLGHGIKLIRDPTSPYCELMFFKYSRNHPIGILALVGLAELAFTAKEKLRTVALLACAKALYELHFGEHATFDQHFTQYQCKSTLPRVGSILPPPNWDAEKAIAAMKPSPTPTFLR